jgi:glutamyl-tRNA reductase
MGEVGLLILKIGSVNGASIMAQRKGFFYHYEARDAAEHLCRVASGMNSMVLGETEIFGQVKKAYKRSLEGGATKSVLNKLFQRAFGVGKKVRTHTAIQEGATSVAGASVELAEKVFGRLQGSSVMVIGAGEMSRKTARALQSRGASSVMVTNRSFDKAADLAEEIGGVPCHSADGKRSCPIWMW